jgi:hypothetical protein
MLREHHSPSATVAGCEVFGDNTGGPSFFMPSDRQLVAVLGAANTPMDTIVSAVTTGTNDLHDSADVSAMLKSTDMSQRTWGLVKVTPSYRANAPILAPFDTLVMSSAPRGRMLEVTVAAGGNDPEGAKNSVKEFNSALSAAVTHLRAPLMVSPVGRPLLRVLDSIRCSADAGNTTMSMEMPQSLVEAMLESRTAPTTQGP